MQTGLYLGKQALQQYVGQTGEISVGSQEEELYVTVFMQEIMKGRIRVEFESKE